VDSTQSTLSILDRSIGLSELIDHSGLNDYCRDLSDLYGISLTVIDLQQLRLIEIHPEYFDFSDFVIVESIANDSLSTYQVDHETETRQLTSASGCVFYTIPIVIDFERYGLCLLGPIVSPSRRVDTRRLADQTSLGEEEISQRVARLRRAADDDHRIFAHVGRSINLLVYQAYRTAMTIGLHEQAMLQSHGDLSAQNRKLEIANRRLRELDELKAGFLATVSHELRTPLTSVIGYSEMLLEGIGGKLTDKQYKYAKTVMEKGLQLLDLIQRILEITKLNSGDAELVVGEISIPELVQQTLVRFKPEADASGVTLSSLIGPDVGMIQADKNKLEQIVWNLVSNAVKFNRSGGMVSISARRINAFPTAMGTVIVQTKAEPPFLLLDVADNGIGIATRDHRRIFRDFFQVDNSRTRQFGGSGIGLTLVKAFVKLHRGALFVESTKDHGTRMSIFIPQYQPNVEAVMGSTIS